MEDRSIHNVCMQRCIDLARHGFREVKSNPMVGAMIVNGDRVLGEGYHEYYGGPHAEVNALNAVSSSNKHLIPGSTLYVTLEPCSHTGKTPPCAHRIVQEKVANVVIGCVDPNPLVAGRGFQLLKDHGINVTISPLQPKCEMLISKFKINLTGLPYVHLKWAQSADNLMSSSHQSTWLSNPISGILSHKYRSQYESILVGKNTILSDDPQLTTRNVTGKNPIRIILDTNITIPTSSKVLSDNNPTLIINQVKNDIIGAVSYIKVDDLNDIESILKMLFIQGITSIIIEGGTKVLNAFIKSGFWHEAMIIQTKKILSDGIKAPSLTGSLIEKYVLQDDEIIMISNSNIIQ